MRKHWVDNLRWVTVLLVLLYHVIYYYNGKGVSGGIGGFGGSQPQDVVMYILYPWFMTLLFLLAGISARYSLQKHTGREWFRSRTLKLLVPATIGLFVFQWITGYFNIATASVAQGGKDILGQAPGFAKYLAMSFIGIGPLWFIQDLWLFSLVLLIVRKIDARDRFWNWCGKAGIVVVIFLGLLIWAGSKTMIQHSEPGFASGLINLYKPFYYLIPFLMGYFVFSHDEVLEKVHKVWIPLFLSAIISCVALVWTGFGEDNTTPQFLSSPLNSLYCWLMCLALTGCFKARFDRTGKFAGYLTRSSFGIYIVHYMFVSSLGYMLKMYTSLPPFAIYIILTVAVFVLSPLAYELLRRIPLVRWAVLGVRKKPNYNV